MKRRPSGQGNKAAARPGHLAAEAPSCRERSRRREAAPPPLFRLRSEVIERKGEARRGGQRVRLPGSLENNLKGTGLSSRFSYGNAIIEEKGRGRWGKPFHSLKRGRFFFFLSPLTKCRLESPVKSLVFANLLHSVTARGWGSSPEAWGAGGAGRFGGTTRHSESGSLRPRETESLVTSWLLLPAPVAAKGDFCRPTDESW